MYCHFMLHSYLKAPKLMHKLIWYNRILYAFFACKTKQGEHRNLTDKNYIETSGAQRTKCWSHLLWLGSDLVALVCIFLWW